MSRERAGADERSTFTVHSRAKDYTVEFDDGDTWARELADVDRAIVIVDENVLRLHRDGILGSFDVESALVLPVSEERKVFDSVASLCERAIQRSAKRNSVLISIGGGITQDVTGFMASVLYRGMRWTYVPTTLLAMADSCIGGKTSLNLGTHKNLLGTIYPPDRVVVHTPFVTTLPDADFASGVGEIVKLHLLGGHSTAHAAQEGLPALMAREPSHVQSATRVSLEIKKPYIEDDEYDRGRRNMLNYGHCFGHALESATDFAIPHGLAVVVGMRLADLVGVRRGLLADDEATSRLRSLYAHVLPTWPALDADTQLLVVDGMAYDKKRTGAGLAVVVLDDDLRASQLSDVTVNEARAALGDMAAGTPG